ncbi:hypothetical protein Q3G72_008688 [Acer saccharum]|nr:hypothetical protein Q3G72_008688 [Acer saccharum]
MIQRSLRTPMVKFLKEHLEKSGCAIGDNFFKAVHCHKKISGGYVRGGGIMVCSNHMNIQVVIHELIHAYGDCRAANLNWANCVHHACSEIRAAILVDLMMKLEILLFDIWRGSETVMARQLRDALLMDKRRMERETHRANTSFNFFHMKSARIEDQEMLNLKILKTKHVAGIWAKKILTMRDAT